MEKITLKPLPNEIVVNNGAAEGAVDLFSYGADDVASRGLGALYVIGHRESDSTNMGYIVSLIAALARREYYAQPTIPPREAFARTLRKANEVVEEFFRTGDMKLSVGIIAVAGGQIMVSKLDKFKILLAREDQVIDILSNVLLFSKEHIEKRRFSSIIHGSIQSGDRILAFVPTRAVTTRERNLKAWFLKLPQSEFAERVTQIGQEHASFATAMLHIDITQSSEPAVMPSPQPTELMPSPIAPNDPLITPSLASQAVAAPSQHSPVAWSPRQQSAAPITATPPAASVSAQSHYQGTETDMPHLIPTEFSLGTRRTTISRLLGRVRFVRLDARGKAIALALVAMLVAGGVLITKSIVLTSPQEQQEQQALLSIRHDIELAQTTSAAGDRTEARGLLSRAMTALERLSSAKSDRQSLQALIVSTLDEIDNAQPVQPTLVASPAPDADIISIATWASASQSIRVGGISGGSLWIATVRDGSTTERADMGSATADLLVGWKGSVLALNREGRTVTRRVGGDVKTYLIPVEETVLDAVEFADALYVLTDRTILKVTDLDTDKPVTKRWLLDDTELAAGALHLLVDGSVYTMSREGVLTTYYKGKKESEVSAPLTPSGTWRLLPWSDGMMAVAAGDARRVYIINPEDGSLVRTLKIDSQIPFIHIAPGPENSALLLTAEGKLWQVK